MNDLLIAEARALISRLDARLAECYEDHPHLGPVPIAGESRRIRGIKQARHRAQRRLNRRIHAAGYPISIRGAMWIINQANSDLF